jgi:hypothetical protein
MQNGNEKFGMHNLVIRRGVFRVPKDQSDTFENIYTR